MGKKNKTQKTQGQRDQGSCSKVAQLGSTQTSNCPCWQEACRLASNCISSLSLHCRSQLMFHGHTGLRPETQGPGSPHLRACVQAVFPACTLILCHFLRAASPDHPVPTMLPILSVAHSVLSQPTMHSGAMCPFATPPSCVQCLPPPTEHKPLGNRNGYFVTASDNAWHTVSL